MLAVTTRRRRTTESGFTLIEVVVSIAVLAVMAGAISAAFSIGTRVLQPNGPTDRLAGAHDFMVLEQQLGRDGSRAVCVQVSSGTKYGSCSNGFTKFLVSKSPTGCPGLCFAWDQVSDSTCQIAAYAIGSNITATRTTYSVASTNGAVSELLGNPLTSDRVDVVVGSAVISPDAEGHMWVKSIPVTITADGTGNGKFITFNQTMVVHPVATDPDGATSAITVNGNPC